MQLVAGADGFVDGWVVVLAETGERLSIRSVIVCPNFADIVEVTEGYAAVGVDIPIGLSEDDRRQPDVEARRMLGGARASSVFPSPLRAVLRSESYREACDVSKAICGRMLSKQTFALLPKIREANNAMTPELQQRVFEVHPEVSFRSLNENIGLVASKHTTEGLDYRESLLVPVYGEYLSQRRIPHRATRDDLYDACAAAWTAWRFVEGKALRLPQQPAIDTRGLRMEIVY